MFDLTLAALEIADLFGIVAPLDERILRRLGWWDIDAAELPSGPRVAVCVVALGIIVICVVNLIASLLQSPGSY